MVVVFQTLKIITTLGCPTTPGAGRRPGPLWGCSGLFGSRFWSETALDLTGLATGVYALRLVLDGQPVTRRLVVE